LSIDNPFFNKPHLLEAPEFTPKQLEQSHQLLSMQPEFVPQPLNQSMQQFGNIQAAQSPFNMSTSQNSAAALSTNRQ
jgi:hypothetical protein